MRSLASALSEKSYPGRGILFGLSECGGFGYIAYFIMGRSENSRNRVFVEVNEEIRTKAFDEKKLTDPSLVIYSPIRTFKQMTIVTNGDQTDTIIDALLLGGSFESALLTREFEPDPPIFTPRISGFMQVEDRHLRYALSILKTEDDGQSCSRFFYRYENPQRGEGRLIHTYMDDGNPPPVFSGEPTLVSLPMGFEEFANTAWESLNQDNKVSLVARSIDLMTGEYDQIVFNKNQ